MPIYEYHCSACGTNFEKLVFGTVLEVDCEKCGSKKTNKCMSRFGLGRSSGESLTGPSNSGTGCSGCASSSCAGCK
ncbi:MAG TPA: FmdB family zinc ribbon protein [Nitrospirota bacterium]|nr:FmdB family zinc ribbon protein [Nitrospirota bacterium]